MNKRNNQKFSLYKTLNDYCITSTKKVMIFSKKSEQWVQKAKRFSKLEIVVNRESGSKQTCNIIDDEDIEKAKNYMGLHTLVEA